MKYFLLLFLFFTSAISQDLNPTTTLKASGLVVDLVYKDKKLYVATSASSVDIFNAEKKELIKTIELPKIKDFMGDIIKSKVYSVDFINDKILITSQGEKGFRRIYAYENNELNIIIDEKSKMFVAKSRFIDDNTILFSLLSNQMFLYDIKKKKINWEIQVSNSKFSDFVLNEKKDIVIVADESGDLKQINIKTGEISKIFSGQNLDNVFQVDFKNGIIATAGQDRRCVVYNTNYDSSYYKKATFLIYSVAVSPQGRLIAFADDEDNNITVFDSRSKENLFKLYGTKSTLTKIIFISEDELFTSSDDEIINYWKLKE